MRKAYTLNRGSQDEPFSGYIYKGTRTLDLKLLGYFGRGRITARGTMRAIRAAVVTTKMIAKKRHRLEFLGSTLENPASLASITALV